MSDQINVRCTLPTQTALVLAIARAGNYLIPAPSEGLAALSPEERAALVPFATTDQGVDHAFRYTVQSLPLSTHPDWAGVVAALQAKMVADQKAREDRAAEIATATAIVLALPPSARLNPYHDQSRALGDIYQTNGGAYLAEKLLEGEYSLPATENPAVLSWIENAKSARAWQRHENDVVLLGAPSDSPSWEAMQALRRLANANPDSILSGKDPLPNGMDTRVVSWVQCVMILQANRRARQTREATAREAREAANRAALIAWAGARSTEVRTGEAEGYDQSGIAMGLALEVIRVALQRLDCESVAFTSDEVEVHRSARGDSLDGLAAIREAVETLRPELPEGCTITVGRLSRWVHSYHSEGCDPVGACAADCRENQKTTVVPVEITGPVTVRALVPVE